MAGRHVFKNTVQSSGTYQLALDTYHSTVAAVFTHVERRTNLNSEAIAIMPTTFALETAHLTYYHFKALKQVAGMDR
jgi:hypothetical protein